MAIKTEIRDKVQILKGTVQKQMILHYVLFQTKKMLFASIVAKGRQRLLASQFVQPLVPPRHLSQISGNKDFMFKKKNKKKGEN